MKMLKWLDENLEESLMLILLGFLSVTMMGQIILRYFFNSPVPWVEEFCRYCFVYSGAISAGYCVRKRLGIRVDVLINFLPKPMQILLEYFSKLLVTGVYLFLAYHSFKLLATTTTVSPAMQIPVKYIYAALPIGFFIGAVRNVQMIIIYSDNLRTTRRGA